MAEMAHTAALMALLVSTSLAGEARFSVRPSAVKDGEGVKIRFTVAAPTDVEVAVVGTDGQVVRHLAAGASGGFSRTGMAKIESSTGSLCRISPRVVTAAVTPATFVSIRCGTSTPETFR